MRGSETDPDGVGATVRRAAPRVSAARLGFGEIGLPQPARTSTRAAAASIIAYYYRLRIALPYFIGGGFYWYFVEDMVPRAGSLWAALAGAWSPPPMHRAVASGTSAGPAPPPPGGAFSYQLGAPFPVGAGVGVVDRDRHVRAGASAPTASAT